MSFAIDERDGNLLGAYDRLLANLLSLESIDACEGLIANKVCRIGFLQWEILMHIGEKNRGSFSSCPDMQWILHNATLLDALLSSGDCTTAFSSHSTSSENQWWETIIILHNLSQTEPKIKNNVDTTELRLAAAIALLVYTFTRIYINVVII